MVMVVMDRLVLVVVLMVSWRMVERRAWREWPKRPPRPPPTNCTNCATPSTHDEERERTLGARTRQTRNDARPVREGLEAMVSGSVAVGAADARARARLVSSQLFTPHLQALIKRGNRERRDKTASTWTLSYSQTFS